jgi:gas vesicle protein
MNDRVYYSREAEARAIRERSIAIFTFLALGLGIGAALALLFAPRSGEKVREDITKSMGEGLERGGEATTHAIRQLSKDLNELRKSVEDRLR